MKDGSSVKDGAGSGETGWLEAGWLEAAAASCVERRLVECIGGVEPPTAVVETDAEAGVDVGLAGVADAVGADGSGDWKSCM